MLPHSPPCQVRLSFFLHRHFCAIPTRQAMCVTNRFIPQFYHHLCWHDVLEWASSFLPQDTGNSQKRTWRNRIAGTIPPHACLRLHAGAALALHFCNQPLIASDGWQDTPANTHLCLTCLGGLSSTAGSGRPIAAFSFCLRRYPRYIF